MPPNSGTPVIGDAVHLWDGEACRAATVVDLDDAESSELLVLAVHVPDNERVTWGLEYVDARRDESWPFDPDTWHWNGAR